MKTYRYTRPSEWPSKGRYTIEITSEEWADHGITAPGYYKYNKRAKGKAGILCSVWLDQAEIDHINAYFAEDAVHCTNDKCQHYWICNNLMSKSAVLSDVWCNKPGKHLAKV